MGVKCKSLNLIFQGVLARAVEFLDSEKVDIKMLITKCHTAPIVKMTLLWRDMLLEGDQGRCSILCRLTPL